MNSVAYRIAEGQPCRACGGILAARHKNSFGLCKSCWNSASLFCGLRFDNRQNRNHGRPIAESDVTLWLANKLELDVKSFAKNGIAGRCEAISGWAYGSPGTQCANRASERRDGHVVCNRHARAAAPQYVGTETASPYTRFSDIILDLCRKDPLFSEMISDVAAARGALSKAEGDAT